MINKLNKKYKKNIIIKKNDNKVKLYDKLLKALNCNGDVCISNYKHIFDEIQFEIILKPKLGAGKDGPISNHDINKIMIQLESKYNDFKYLGTVPLNFTSLFRDEYMNIDWDKYKRQKKCVGMVINTDPLPKPGQHWISLFIDCRESVCKIYFFDSLGKLPPKEIVKYIQYIKKNINGKIEYKVNKKKHQRKGNDCGIYSIYFIQKMIEKDDKLFKTYIYEDKMNKERLNYYYIDYE